jgi:hypothetical protein
MGRLVRRERDETEVDGNPMKYLVEAGADYDAMSPLYIASQNGD